jgi:membrane associated rhomboid family serine protease
MIGASGAISGILGAYLLLYPRARVLVLLPLGVYTRLLRLPAMVVLGFWFVFQIINTLLTTSSGEGVAWGAHLGGFTAGVLLIPVFKYRDVSLFHPRNT